MEIISFLGGGTTGERENGERKRNYANIKKKILCKIY